MSLASLKSAFSSAVATAEAKLVADAKGELQSLSTPAGRAAAAEAFKGVLTEIQPIAASLDPSFGSAVTSAISAIPTIEKVADVAAAVI